VFVAAKNPWQMQRDFDIMEPGFDTAAVIQIQDINLELLIFIFERHLGSRRRPGNRNDPGYLSNPRYY
jgi:hypothetical protein